MKRIARGSRELINLILCQVWLASSAGNESRLPYGYTYRGARLKQREKIHFIEASAYHFNISTFRVLWGYKSLLFHLLLAPLRCSLETLQRLAFKKLGRTSFFGARAQKPHFAHAANVNGICLLIIQGKLSKLLNERAGKDKKFFFPGTHKRTGLKSTRENHGCIPKQKSFFHPLLFMFISLREGTAKKWLDT